MDATILPFPSRHAIIDTVPDCPSLYAMARVLQRHYADLNPSEQIIARECILISQRPTCPTLDFCKAMAWARHILDRHALLQQAFREGDCRKDDFI